MSGIRNDLLLRSLRRQAVPRRPLWLMRQAGRYLPEYLQLRQQAPDFMSFCKQPKLAVEATLQPIERFGFDAAIIFSDILTIPDALGCGVKFTPGYGPTLKCPITSAADVAALPRPNMSQACDYVYQALAQAKQRLAAEVPLIGFSGSPWTLACYMLQGAGSKDFMLARRFLYSEPDAMHALLQHLAELITEYLQLQIAAGADVVMLFDSWGGLLTPSDYCDFSLKYMQQIMHALGQDPRCADTPCVLFSKGALGHSFAAMAQTSAAAVGVDWSIKLSDLIQRYPQAMQDVTLQGNLDPALLFADKKSIVAAVHNILDSTRELPGFIFNLGHGIDRHTPIDAVHTLVSTVKQYALQLQNG